MKRLKFLLIASALLLAFGCNKEETPSGGSEEAIPHEEFTVEGVSFKMIAVEGGTFTMGAPNQDPEAGMYERPAHKVTLSDYYIGETEVTQELWVAVMGSNPSKFKNPENPVECVSWNNIVNNFLPKLNDLTGKNFTLPTEAQWEFAARGGKKSKGYIYSGSNNPDEVAWYYNNSEFKIYPVKQKLPNELGIFDMSGNVTEWVSDWYGAYSEEEQTNPTGPVSGGTRVLRGGSKGAFDEGCRVWSRNNTNPDFTSILPGFRLALAL